MNLEKICRACALTSAEMFSLFSQMEYVGNYTLLADMLMACTSSQVVANDGMPKLMCRNCVIDLSNAYTFKLRCEKTDSTLRQYLTDDPDNKTAILNIERNIAICQDKDNFKIKLPLPHTRAKGKRTSRNSLKTAESSIVEVFSCKACTVSFKSNVELEEHFKACHSETINSNDDVKVEKCEEGETETKPDFDDFTDIGQTIDSLDETDTKSFHDGDMDDDASFTDNMDDSDKKTELLFSDQYYTLGDRYICVECNASLSTIGNLHRHIKIHLKKSRNVCRVCKKSFARSDSLAEHMKRHENTKPFECELCKKTYSTKGALSTHMYTHDRIEGKLPKERLHECSYCKKCFMSNSSLVIHIRTHTKEKPFLCQTCGKGFATRGGVDLHQRRHTGERPFKCEFCGRGFAESSNLKVHIRAHTGDRPHLCSLCGKRFTRMFLLQLHIRTHTGEKPYACPDCPKAFAQQGDLAAHKRTHTGQRPHKCPQCDQGFIKSSGLKKHIQSKHSNDVKPTVAVPDALPPVEAVVPK